MALVRGVMAASIFDSSMLSVSSRTSTNTGTPPRSTNAFAVETKVNEGMMISSPGPMPARIAAISSAPVPECVSSALGQPVVRSSQAWQRLVNGPSPERWLFSCACRMYSSSRPVRNGLLNGTKVSLPQLPRGARRSFVRRRSPFYGAIHDRLHEWRNPFYQPVQAQLDCALCHAADQRRAPGGKLRIIDHPQQDRLEHAAMEADRYLGQISHRAGHLGHGDPVQRIPHAGGVFDAAIAVDASPEQLFGERFREHDRDIEVRLIGEQVVCASEAVLRPGPDGAPHRFQR